MKPVYPSVDFGVVGKRNDWDEWLPKNSFGHHPPWCVPRGDGVPPDAAKAVALVPWLLFNRALWLAQAEAMPATHSSLNVLVPHADSEDEQLRGWFVRLKLSSDFDVMDVDAVATDHESAPSPEGFVALPPGARPPTGLGSPSRRRGLRLRNSIVLGALAIGGCLLWSGLFGASDDDERRYSQLRADLSMIQARAADLQSQLSGRQQLGIAPTQAAVVLVDALLLNAQVRVDGQQVRWLDAESGSDLSIAVTRRQPRRLLCDPPPENRSGGAANWRNCRWKDD